MLPLVKAELLSVLADVYDEASWSDGTLEESLRQGLVEFSPFAMVHEESFVLLEAGYEHDLTTLGAYEIMLIGYPWYDESLIGDTVVAWRLIAPNKVRMDGLPIAAGESVRVQFRPLHTIQFLDGGTETSLVGVERARFLLIAARCALRLRMMDLLRQGASADRLASLVAAMAELSAAFEQVEVPSSSSSSFVVWGPMGQEPCVSW